MLYKQLGTSFAEAVRILLDTHVALWVIADTAKLSDGVKKLIRPKDAPKHNDPFDRMLLAAKLEF